MPVCLRAGARRGWCAGFERHHIAADLAQLVIAELDFGIDEMALDSAQMFLVGANRLADVGRVHIVEMEDD